MLACKGFWPALSTGGYYFAYLGTHQPIVKVIFVFRGKMHNPTVLQRYHKYAAGYGKCRQFCCQVWKTLIVHVVGKAAVLLMGTQ